MGTKHTPTPWRTAGSGLQIKAKENGYLVAVVEGPDRRARGKEWQEDHDYCQGNAAFIVRACNSHDQLVAALRGEHRAVDWLLARLIDLDPKFKPSQSPVWPALVAAREAIEAAGAA